ncbi:MAG TPA: sugar phosphate isomerase/epimerase family protein [Bryobacteraceae bacterium]
MRRRAFLMTAAAVPALHAAGADKPAKGGLRLGVITQIGKDPDAGIKRVKDFGFPTCQIYAGDSDPAVAKPLRAALDRYGIEATAFIAGGPGPEVYDFYQGPLTIGLIPRQYRAGRVAAIKKASEFAKLCGVRAVQTHCGFIPENPNDPVYKELVGVLREVALYCKQNGQSFRCETGQETPITLVRAIRDVNVEGLGVNLDAANLIMYGKANPVDAVDVLAPYIQGVHAKDGLYPTDPKELGKEVPIGKGKVNFPEFIKKLKAAGYHGALTIEREVEGAEQKRDIIASKAFLEKLI